MSLSKTINKNSFNNYLKGLAMGVADLIPGISGGTVAGFIFVINLFDLPGNNLLKKKGYNTNCLIEFPGH